MAKLPAKTSQSLRCALTRRLKRYPQPLLCSINYDNGCENVEHEYTNKVLGTQPYFLSRRFLIWLPKNKSNALKLYLTRGPENVSIIECQMKFWAHALHFAVECNTSKWEPRLQVPPPWRLKLRRVSSNLKSGNFRFPKAPCQMIIIISLKYM